MPKITKKDYDRINKAINRVRPYLKADGGDIELKEVTDDWVVKVKLMGACEGCPFVIQTLKSGVEQMRELVAWYRAISNEGPIGFFQIGGGIAGDFPICVVPLIQQDLKEQCRLWGYFAQISDSTTSYGSYSGAVPSEKISWGKLDVDTPSYVIESDATIVAPLIFNYILEPET